MTDISPNAVSRQSYRGFEVRLGLASTTLSGLSLQNATPSTSLELLLSVKALVRLLVRIDSLGDACGCRVKDLRRIMCLRT